VPGIGELVRVDAELGVGVLGKGVVSVQLLGNGPGGRLAQALAAVEGDELFQLGGRIGLELLPFACEKRLLGVPLTADRRA
jgi:hypothetical protein